MTGQLADPGPSPGEPGAWLTGCCADPVGASDRMRWYGNAAVWVLLSVSGVLGTDPQRQRPWFTKVPWWRTVPGVLTIRARPVGGRVAGFHADVPSGYAPTGFQPSGLRLAGP